MPTDVLRTLGMISVGCAERNIYSGQPVAMVQTPKYTIELSHEPLQCDDIQVCVVDC